MDSVIYDFISYQNNTRFILVNYAGSFMYCIWTHVNADNECMLMLAWRHTIKYIHPPVISLIESDLLLQSSYLYTCDSYYPNME